MRRSHEGSWGSCRFVVSIAFTAPIWALRGSLARSQQDSPSTISFLAWVLKDICWYSLAHHDIARTLTLYSTDGFRQRDRYGRLTRKQLMDARVSSVLTPKATHLSPFAQRLLSFAITFPFFGIPRTYLAHTKVASEPRGRLADMQENWEIYTEQLSREYSEFVLAVCLSLVPVSLSPYLILMQSTVLLS